MPKRFDQAYADWMLGRLAELPADAQPRWGKMNVAQLIGHLNMVLRYSMGDGPEMPFKGNWKSRVLFRPLILNQIVQIPKGVKIPRPPGAKEAPVYEADLDTLRETAGRYLARVAAGDLPATRTHPFFGGLSPEAWRKFHAAHCGHHLRQFGVG